MAASDVTTAIAYGFDGARHGRIVRNRNRARAWPGGGHGLTLVARRAERLESLAEELSSRSGVRVEPIAADLADASDRDRLVGEVESRGLTVEILVNNAGFGVYEPFSQSDRGRELQQVRLLVEAVVDLNARYLPGMLERGRRAILNMASTAGFQPLPGNADYSASKSFALFHSEALHEEVRGQGVTVTAVCPGPVKTEFLETSKPLFAARVPRPLWIDAQTVAREGLDALEAGRRTVVPGRELRRHIGHPTPVRVEHRGLLAGPAEAGIGPLLAGCAEQHNLAQRPGGTRAAKPPLLVDRLGRHGYAATCCGAVGRSRRSVVT